MKKIIVFYRYDVKNIDDVIDFKFCLRQQILINYISFESPAQKKGNGASGQVSLCYSGRNMGPKTF